MAENSSNWDARLLRGSGNSFDVLRLCLASLVVFGHSFFLIDGNSQRDPLIAFSGGQANSGGLAVYFFFVISGFLVTRSWFTDPSLRRFMARRVARIVPAFLVATAFGFFLVGPLAAVSVRLYFSAQHWLAIAAQAVALKQAVVPGTLSRNAVPLVHGTLWTIQYEFDCYLAIAILGFVGLLSGRKVTTYLGIGIALGIATLFRARLPVINNGWPALLIASPDQWPNLLPFFFCGSAFYVFRGIIPKTAILFWLCVVGFLLGATLGHFYAGSLICGTYAVLYVALSTQSSVKIGRRKVDISYGIYLFGWPIQQLLLFWFIAWMTPVLLFASAMILTCAVAWLSWRFVEAPCLMLVRNPNAERPAIVSENATDGEFIEDATALASKTAGSGTV